MPHRRLDDEYDLKTRCGTLGCPWPDNEELHRTPWCVTIEGHTCFGGVTHQHRPRGRMGGKNPASRIVGLICQGIHMAVDNGDIIDGGRQYSDRVAVATEDHGPQYIISLKTKTTARPVMVHLIPPAEQGVEIPPVTEVGKVPEGNGTAVARRDSQEVAASMDLATAIASLITPTGLAPLPDSLPYERWDEVGVTLSRFQQATQWAWGDWIRFGEEHYPDIYTQAKAMTGREEQTLMNIASVARAFPDAESRQREVSFSVYAEVASMARKDAQGAQDVLQQAEAAGWTQTRVRAELRPSVSAPAKDRRWSASEILQAHADWPEKSRYRTNLAAGLAALLDWMRTQ